MSGKMDSNTNYDQGISVPRSPHRPPTSTSSRSPLKDASPNFRPAKELVQHSEITQDLRERVYNIVMNRVEDELQDLMEEKTRVLAKPTVRVQFRPVVGKDKVHIHNQVFAQDDLSLQEVGESVGKFLLELWINRAKKLISTYKKNMDLDIVQEARSRARYATEGALVAALEEVENLNTTMSTPRKEQHIRAIRQKTPTQLPVDARSKNTTPSTTAALERQPGSRYNLRTRPTPKEGNMEVLTEGKPSDNVKSDPPDSPTPGSGLRSAQRTRDRRGKSQPPAIAAVREGIQKLSIEDNSGTLNLLSRLLIDSLDNHLGTVDELMNKESRSVGIFPNPGSSIRKEIIMRNVTRTFISLEQKEICQKVSSICADVLLDWITYYRDTIDLLEHEGSKLVQDALLAVGRAKADFYNQLCQLRFTLPRPHPRGSPRKRKLVPRSSPNLEAKATASTTEPKGSVAGRGESTSLELPSLVHTSPTKLNSLAILKNATVSKSPSRHARDRPPPPMKGLPRQSPRHALRSGMATQQPSGSYESSQVLSTLEDPFVAVSFARLTSQRMEPDQEKEEGAEKHSNVTLREKISSARDKLLTWVRLEYGGLENAQSVPECRHAILATYNQAARRLTEELKDLDHIRERENQIRENFEELMTALSYLDIEDTRE